LKRTTLVATSFVIGIIIIASIYGVYNAYLASPTSSSPTPTPTASSQPTSTPTLSPTATSSPQTSSSPTPTSHQSNPTVTPSPSPTPAPTSVTVTDGAGNTMTIPLPVTKIAALDGGVAEILCAMGVEDLIVARTDSCTMPPSIKSVESMGENDYEPNVERLITLDPDIIFASSMLPYNTVLYQQLLTAGIAVFIVDTTTPEPQNPSEMTAAELYAAPTPIDFACRLMQNFTSIVGHQDEVDEYVDWAQNYNKLVKDRIATLTPDQRVPVLLEWYQPYQTFVTLSVYQGGGINIAEDQEIFAPILNAEFVVEHNPSVIIRMIASNTHNINDFIAARNEILGRTAIQDVDAVKYGRVYICDFYARSGVRSVVGYLYWAKWLQPSLFADIDPATVNQELNQKFFGSSIAGTFAYP
jgi:iron complex transport system substrate-binding protein